MKFLGARSVHPYAVWPKSRLLVDIDWNNQPNGSYLSAGLVLSPEATTENPLTGADWLKVEYVGVPPGKNARMVIASKARGREKFLHTEGWPDKNKVGRPIGVQRVEVVIEGGKVQIQENGQTVWDSSEKLLSFEKGYLYLQMSSHSNYPAREVFFKNVTISD